MAMTSAGTGRECRATGNSSDGALFSDIHNTGSYCKNLWIVIAHHPQIGSELNVYDLHCVLVHILR